MRYFRWLMFATVFAATAASADSLKVVMHLVTAAGVGKASGVVTASDTNYGVVLSPNLTDLSPGMHGFHVHQNPACGAKEKNGKMVPGLAAGGHYDPKNTGFHSGPYGEGHLGDLPALYVDAPGKATYPILAPRLRVADLQGRSLMIHAGGDNNSDNPKKLGGGGARMACGVVK